MNTPSEGQVVLVVDDEEMVAQATCDMLDYLGHASVAVSTGQEAIDYFRRQQANIYLVILDCKLPDLSGDQVFVQLKEISPETPILMATGLALDEPAMTACLEKCDGYLQKPYGLKKLGDALRNVMTSTKD